MKPKKPSKPSANSQFAGTEIEHIEHLLNFMTEHNLEEFEYSRGDLKIRLKKPSVNAVVGARQFAAPEIIVPGAAGRGSMLPSGRTTSCQQDQRCESRLKRVCENIVQEYM